MFLKKKCKGQKDEEEIWAATRWPQGKEKILELEEEALDCTLWRTRFGRAYGPVVILTNSATTDWWPQHSNINNKSLRTERIAKLRVNAGCNEIH